ncbi:MAG TPA: SGNH hydrolase domain-containing protein, partial [Longimicrobium sp.]|nr:SGNH hydrolase domain-containing protein [Longimicrobium sp.]
WRSAAAPRACKEFQRAAVAELSRTVKRGDVVFLPGLRIARISDSWAGRPIRERLRPKEKEAMYREALATLTTLSSTGAAVVLEAPLPVFPSPAFRCSDWFNRANPICRRGMRSGRAEMEARRAPVVARMRLLAASVPNLTVWDPFPVICPGEVCTVYRDGHPLFIDTDHLSGRGNDLLYPSFAHAVEVARRARMASHGGSARR